jgi:Cof subfamily protein (haloacid dehalogenase superfamily)
MCSKHSADTIMPQLDSKLSKDIHMYRSNDTLIEITPVSVSKRSAIAHILKPTESLKNMIAFGDNYNDIEMLKAAGYGVAVANARTEVKRIADYVTLANTDDGVAHFIQHQFVI